MSAMKMKVIGGDAKLECVGRRCSACGAPIVAHKSRQETAQGPQGTKRYVFRECPVIETDTDNDFTYQVDWTLVRERVNALNRVQVTVPTAS